MMRSCLGLVLALLPAPLAPADRLRLKDGTEVEGQIVKDGPLSLTFKGLDGAVRTHDKAAVAAIELTYGPPRSALEDPAWSPFVIEDRLRRDLGALAGKMKVIRTKHYIVFTNASAGRQYPDTMEDVYARFQRTFPFEERAGERLLPVFLFSTGDQYVEFCQRVARMTREQAGRTAGHAWRDYYACHYASPKDPIHYHEGAHQLVHNRLGIRGGGSWFQEGLAVYFESLVFPEQRVMEIVRAMVKSNRYTLLRDLCALRSLVFSTDATKSAAAGQERYHQAGAIIRFLKDGKRGQDFPKLLEAVGGLRSDDWGEIARKVYGVILEQIELEWLAYMKEYKG